MPSALWYTGWPAAGSVETEQDVWLELHCWSMRSGGEWSETRVLTGGQRTNPWLQECSDRMAKRGDMLGFHTNLIATYGYCGDAPRSWTIGHLAITGGQRPIYSAALSQIEHNKWLIRAEMEYREHMEKTWPIPDRCLANRCDSGLRGVGLADEYPGVPHAVDPGDFLSGRFDENMVFCAESLLVMGAGARRQSWKRRLW